jgi:hypothetical protein
MVYSPRPIFVIVLDITGAFDSTWRNALLYKLYKKNVPLRKLLIIKKLLASVYMKVKGSTQGYFECLKGLLQGDVNSGFFYTTYLDDIHDYLKKMKVGIELYSWIITALLFLDDIAMIAFNPKQVEKALNAIYNYGEIWRIPFSIDKCKVIVFNSNKYRGTRWKFGNRFIQTVHKFKYLNNIYTGNMRSDAHFEARLDKGETAHRMVKGAQLLGGETPIPFSSIIVQALVWTILDSGRVVATVSRHLKKTRDAYKRFQIKIARDILDISKTTSHWAILAELGWIPDIHRAHKKLLIFLAKIIYTNGMTFKIWSIIRRLCGDGIIKPNSMPYKFVAYTVVVANIII